jgi:hypothetical protein
MVIVFITRCFIAMVAVMGHVFSLEYNCHVPLCFEGQAVRTCGWLYATKFFNLLAVGLLAIF